MGYASTTHVGSDRSLTQIRALLIQAGATAFALGEQDNAAQIGFQLNGIRVRYNIPLPLVEEFALTPNRRYRRTPVEQRRLHTRAINARWRAIHLLIRAKLEAVKIGAIAFEDAFLAETVMSNNATVAEWGRAQLKAMISGYSPRELAEAGIV